MLPYLTILGRTVPTYGVLGMVGLGLGLLLALARCKRFSLSRDDCAYIFILGAVGALIGAKVLYLLTVLPALVSDFPLIWQQPSLFLERYIAGGMVFYGGFLGGVAGGWGASRYFGKRFSDFFPVLAPALPLIHAVGRIGCFCAGCCHGMEAPAPWGVVFSQAIAAPNGVPLLPVQLYECVAELLICAFLLWYTGRATNSGAILRAYVYCYAPVRFVLEFFRGDMARGAFGVLSTSQWISLLLFIGAVLWQRLTAREHAEYTEYNE